MKKTAFVLLALALSVMPCFSDPIDLKKEVKNNPNGPRTTQPEVSADITDGVVIIDVNRYAGNATVEITDANGTTWQTDTTYVYGHAQMNMNVSSIACGSYTLTITLANGITYEGEFEIAD